MNNAIQTKSLCSQFAENAALNRKKRIDDLAKTFATAGIKYTSKNKSQHLILQTKHGLIDYYPDSTRWEVRLTKQQARGFQALLNFATQ